MGGGRPGTVPALNDALALLGVRLKVNESDFVVPSDAVKPAEPLAAPPAQVEQVRAWLRMVAGN